MKPKRLNVSISFLSVVCVCPSAFLLQGEKKQQSALQKGGVGGGSGAPASSVSLSTKEYLLRETRKRGCGPP